MTEDEKKLIQARHRLEAVQARNRVQERKARTRRLTPTQAAREPVWERCSKPRNSGGKTRCVRDGTARSNYWTGGKRGQMP